MRSLDGAAACFLSVGSSIDGIRRIGVVGLGTMGAGIAQVALQAGMR